MRLILPMIAFLAAPVAALAADPVPVIDGRALVTPEAMAFDARAQRDRVRIAADPGAAARPVLPDDTTTPAARFLRAWLAAGQAAGLAGVLYDNRDRGHSALDPDAFPQLVHIDYGEALRADGLDLGLAGPFLFDAPVLGNSSTALTSGAGARGLPRLAMTAGDGPGRAAQTALADHLYVYPVWRDHEALDLLPANWGYMVAAEGASRSDRPFLEAFALTLASFTPETRAAMAEARLMVPTLQMILRRSMAGITSDTAYLSGRAHPAVFDGSRVRPEAMMVLANRLTPDTLPPRALIAVEEEDFTDTAGLAGLSERLFDTPEAVARIWRGWEGRRSLRLAAGAQPAGRAEGFVWVLLQGDSERVRIVPLDAGGRRVEVTLDWHDRRPAAPRSPRLTDRVDIAVFARRGDLWSAPAFLSIAFPGHEARSYAPGPDGAPRLISVDYDALGRGAEFDPWLHFSAPWADEAVYGPDGRLAGWRRSGPGGAFDFDSEGRLGDGRILRHRLDEDGPGGARLLRMEQVAP